MLVVGMTVVRIFVNHVSGQPCWPAGTSLSSGRFTRGSLRAALECAKRYRTGRTSKVKAVEDRMPPITTVASGRCTSAPCRPRWPSARNRAKPRGRSSVPAAGGSGTVPYGFVEELTFCTQAADKSQQHRAVQHGDPGQSDEADAGRIDNGMPRSQAPPRRRSRRTECR